MTDIFISYAREDQETARRLAEALARQGWSVWWDRRIPTGRRFHQVIERELAAARCVIALWSKAALNSSWVWEEAQDGLDRDILVPARIETIPLPIGFRTIQTADLRDWRGGEAHPGFAQLLEDITATLDVIETEAKPEKPVAVFRDIDEPWCPEMVVLPRGEFLMGSPKKEKGRWENEGPQHLVMIGRRFAIGRYPVTFAEYDHFCAVMKRGKLFDQGWDRGRRPAINVNWRDAVAYCEWLSPETGKSYRLPTEAEWEYACRAGTTTRYACGDEISVKDANFGKEIDQTTEVGSYPPNSWGLYDMHGNVWEWVEDIWHDGYEGAPADGSAWTVGEGNESSQHRVIRGGSWDDVARALRSAGRYKHEPGRWSYTLGFRVAQMLD